jgi:hypothetical protein
MRDASRCFDLNPVGKYPSESSRRVERNADRVLLLLPKSTVERTRDCIQIDCGGEKGILILVTPESIELRLSTLEWKDQHLPNLSSRFWKRIQANETTDIELETLLKEAIKERQNEFRNCSYCGMTYTPERMHSEDVCHVCAEDHLGVKY